MHKVSFSPQFEKEATAMGHSLQDLKADLKLHLDSVGTGTMPVPYLGRTGAFTHPQAVVESDLQRIHVFDVSCPNFNAAEQDAWNRARNLHKRTSDTYFVYTKEFFDEHHCHFLGVINPAHIKCNFNHSGMTWFGPLIDAADKFNGM
ncbi:type II toxin-antitoxin system YafO family toxin [Vibrio parahaemolyticus]|uniref:type II toxin-antitoxin system YafO family toxin n=1 Tax=Vibrio parahaemolyticus TaxID=670 RepID=UPI0021122FB5|nr:type II toxin-antitoxin system YafO family toxin [Vibrio parahaemolyticus]ELB2788951.1 type II toxin-antitoxin system YafO family toxin [Vibrio alginolyticus]MCQ4503034.1 type II toxin-antitoxin system YafO family toxin [Vibrio parahaemolyticus]MCQ6458163.1 type II toxin-antitoxin system YafO family toxin [Vibrio parahaemolyticus]MCQ6463145.1 type II toxin-antitoxin system YafO family toxin [Vibrio parahaemolyticus]MCQ6467992.1 type II toxin-antitoxin system YafO family toxin [Vibrio paraha